MRLNDDKLMEMANGIARNDQEHKSFRRRLDDLEKEMQKQNGILITLQKQGDAIETMTKALKDVKTTVGSIDARVDRIEREPADKWKKIGMEIVKYLVLAAIGFAAGAILK